MSIVMRLNSEHTHCPQEMPSQIGLHRRLEDHQRPPRHHYCNRSQRRVFCQKLLQHQPVSQKATTLADRRLHTAPAIRLSSHPNSGRMLAIVDSSRSPRQMVRLRTLFVKQPAVTFARQPQNTKYFTNLNLKQLATTR